MENNEKAKKEPETSEDIKEDMETGEKEGDVYSEEGRENLENNDEIEPAESGFMEGAEGRGKKGSCAECGALISEDDGNIVEKEINGEVKWFCSEEHAENYSKKHKEEENPERVEE